jgi:Fe2+ or Zn2+ uptake regulation protein
VLTVLGEVGGHQSADDLVLALRRAGYPHARTTVYNALQDLARAGLVREAPVAAGALRYEADTEPHQHFVCRSCGVIFNVAAPPAAGKPPAPPVAGIHEVDTVDLVYRGLCERCAAAPAGGDGSPESDTAAEG